MSILPSFKPMLCSAVDVVPPSDAFIAHQKIDGWRALAIVDDGVRIKTRSENIIPGVPYLNEAFASLPDGTVIDGEIWDAANISGGWNRVQTICSSDAIHVPAPGDEALVFEAFDILFFGGEDLRTRPLTERLERLSEVIDGIRSLGVTVVQKTPELPSTDQALLDALEAGYEGLVAKRKDSPYVGGRPGSWVKLKPTATESAEAEVVGFNEGKGKYQGKVGSIRFRLPNGSTGQCSGFNDELRQTMTDNKADYIGTVIEVAHWGITVDGKLRHPQFRAIRYDRSVDEMLATAEQMPVADAKPVKPKKARVAKTKDSPKKMRNYKSMGLPKLITAVESLRTQSGDAYDRCLNGGSGDPDADLVVAEAALAAKQVAV